MAEIILKTEGLTKSYGGRTIVQNVTFELEEGQILGLVGKNGAGKTTLIRLLTGIIKPTAGTFSLYGKDKDDIEGVLCNVSTMIEHPALYMDMTAKDNLLLQCMLKGIKDPINSGYVSTKLDEVGLGDLYASKKKVKHFSLGMKQRLGIAIATIGEPKLMLLDEPTNGLDPEGIIQIRNLLVKLNKEKGVTILISSHILSELSTFATSYLFINNGKLVEQISAEDLKHLDSNKLIIATDDNMKAYEILKETYNVTLDNDVINIHGDIEPVEIINLLAGNQIKLTKIDKVTNNVEDHFMELMGGR